MQNSYRLAEKGRCLVLVGLSQVSQVTREETLSERKLSLSVSQHPHHSAWNYEDFRLRILGLFDNSGSQMSNVNEEMVIENDLVEDFLVSWSN